MVRPSYRLKGYCKESPRRWVDISHIPTFKTPYEAANYYKNKMLSDEKIVEKLVSDFEEIVIFSCVNNLSITCNIDLPQPALT